MLLLLSFYFYGKTFNFCYNSFLCQVLYLSRFISTFGIVCYITIISILKLLSLSDYIFHLLFIFKLIPIHILSHSRLRLHFSLFWQVCQKLRLSICLSLSPTQFFYLNFILLLIFINYMLLIYSNVSLIWDMLCVTT